MYSIPGYKNGRPDSPSHFWTINDILEGTALPRVPTEKFHEILERNSLELLGLE